MRTRQIIFLMFLSLMVGSIIGFLGLSASKNKNKISSFGTIQKLMAMSDEDFLTAYPNEKHLLTLGEQALGDRLFNRLEKIKNIGSTNNAKPIKPLPKALSDQNLDEPETQQEVPESNDFSYFSKGNIHLAPKAIPGAKLQRIFKNKKFSAPNEDSFGVENNLIENVREFLKKQGCKNPSFTAMTEEKKNRSKFFDLVRDNSFKGATIINVKNKEKSLPTKIEFNSPTHSGYDYFEVVDEKKNFLEKRIVRNDQPDDAWRYSSCEPAVILVSDKCPWNNQYVYEFKSFYLSPDSKKMVGNVYCKKPSDEDWTQVGLFDLNQSAEDRE